MDLSNIDLLSLQTSFMQKDIFVQALCRALNPYFQELSDSVKQVYIYGRLDELDEEAIDSLAWQFHVDFYDYTMTLNQKRELVKQSKILHKIKGTPAAVERAATTVFGKSKLKEWYEYGGKPYFFGIDLDITESGVDEKSLEKLEMLIMAYKNERSWLDFIHMYLTSHCKVYYAATTCSGESITVYPYQKRNLETHCKVKVAIGNATGLENITVYPKKEAK